MFMLMFLAGMQTADAHHKHRGAKAAPPPKHHHVRPPPRHISHKAYRHDGHKYYDEPCITEGADDKCTVCITHCVSAH